ncbi:MAG TPA: ribonuclease domain-containing protein [Thermoanaerobaculia bacterium]|nr:ribonuclease domain-containing protein [Thermoanaerobaculia bacterium]
MRRLLYVIIAALAVAGTTYVRQHANPPAAGRAEARPTSNISADERAAIDRTLKLIEQGGPFPYSRDGVTFQNREHQLPPRPSGYYREYTVPTPGAANRGARRIVRGRDGDTWYTNDHYKTFVRIDE